MAPGAVTVDPYPPAPSLSFLVAAGATVGWRLPHITGCGSPLRVPLPPDGKEAPPGPYWPIGRSQGLTSAHALSAALEAAGRRLSVRDPGCAATVRELWVPGRLRSARSVRSRVPLGEGR